MFCFQFNNAVHNSFHLTRFLIEVHKYYKVIWTNIFSIAFQIFDANLRIRCFSDVDAYHNLSGNANPEKVTWNF